MKSYSIKNWKKEIIVDISDSTIYRNFADEMEVAIFYFVMNGTTKLTEGMLYYRFRDEYILCQCSTDQPDLDIICSEIIQIINAVTNHHINIDEKASQLLVDYNLGFVR